MGKLTAEHIRKHGKRINNLTLAVGEQTGHAHVVTEAEGVERYELDGRRYLLVSNENGVSLQHAEHGTGRIAPGVYEERIDREYDYTVNNTLLNNIREVVD